MEVALYVRVSTTLQQHTQTIEQQVARLQEYVTMQPDWHVAEEHIYRDDGYSGAKLQRPGLDRLRDRAALAAFEQVLITAPDRLARNYVHQLLLIDELSQRGCRVEFLDGEPDRMTEAEQNKLAERALTGIRLACQIVVDHDMSLRAISRLEGSGRADAGGPPAAEKTQPPVWLAR